MTDLNAMLERFRALSDPFSEEGITLATYILEEAPPEIKRMFYAELEAAGVFPKTTHVFEDGSPAFSVEQAAEALNLPVATVRRHWQKIKRDYPNAAATGPVYPIC